MERNFYTFIGVGNGCKREHFMKVAGVIFEVANNFEAEEKH